MRIKYLWGKIWKKWKLLLVITMLVFIILFRFRSRLQLSFFAKIKDEKSTYTTVHLKKAETMSDKSHLNQWVMKKLQRNASFYIMPNSNTALILPSSFCVVPITLLVIIFSTPEHFNHRVTIRETWGSYINTSNRTVKGYFLMGQPKNPQIQRKLKEEFSTYGDMIQERFLDTRYNDSIKSLMMLKVVNQFCVPNIEYLVKTADDVYVNVPQLLEFLPQGGENILMGYVQQNSTPIRDETHDWYVPTELFRDSQYPDYLGGSSYVMTSDVVSKIYNASLYSEVFFVEDVYITGLLPKVIHLRPIDHEMFIYVEEVTEPCILNTVITFMHNMKRTDMSRMHKWLRHGNYRECKGTLYITNAKCFFVPRVDGTTDAFAPSVSLEFLS